NSYEGQPRASYTADRVPAGLRGALRVDDETRRPRPMPSARSYRLVGSLCAALLLSVAIGIAPDSARAQVGENQLVQAPDGSLYVFENGELHPIAPVTVSVPQLLGLPL